MKSDVISSYIFRGLNIALRFFLIPIYIGHLGIGSYGIIGFFSTLMTSMVFFDFGLGVASTKIIAEANERLKLGVSQKIRTIELIYLFIAIALGLIIISGSEIISEHWLVIDDPDIDANWLVKLMGVLFIFTWPKSLYAGFFAGTKKIVVFNKIQIFILLLQSVLLYIGLKSVYSHIDLYFYILIIVSFIETLLLRFFSMRSFKSDFSFASFQELKSIFKFSSGVGLLSILALVAFQFDKITISKVFNIELFGEYTLASVVPFSLLTLIYPITASAFPRMVNVDTDNSALNIFKGWSVFLLLVSVSFCVLVGVNFPSIYFFWLTEFQNSLVELSIILLTGIFLHSTTVLLYNLFLANGKSWIVTLIYSLSICVYVGSYFFESNPTTYTMAYSWVYFNIALFICFSVVLFNFNRQLFKYYYGVLILLVAIFVSLSFLMGWIIGSSSSNEYRLLIYTFGFGVFFTSILVFVVKKGILKY